jgi:hypothetical protein
MKKLVFILAVLAFSFNAFSQKRITSIKTKDDLLNEEYCSSLFSTAHGDYFDLVNDEMTASSISYLNILDWLQGRVAGLRIYTTRNNVRIPVIRNHPATIFVDEMRMSYDFLNMLPVADIAMIKIIKGPFIGNFGGAGGAIAIYTIRGDDDGESAGP